MGSRHLGFKVFALSFLLLGLVLATIIAPRDDGGRVAAQAPGRIAGGQSPTQVGAGGQTFKGKTTANGDILITAKNVTKEAATDFHITILKPTDAKISAASVSAPMGEKVGAFPGTPIPNSNPAANHPPAKSVAIKRPEGGTDIGPNWDTHQTIDIVVVDKDGNPLNLKEVELKLQWSRGAAANVLISGFGSDAIGEGDPITVMASLDVPGWTGTPKAVVEGSGAVTLDTFVVAERDGTRFDRGDLVVSLNRLGMFTDVSNLIVEVRDEDGSVVTGAPDRITIEEVRINAEGAIVVTITRDSADESPLMLVFRNATVTGINTFDPGATVAAKVSGSAVYGWCLRDFVELFTIVAEE